MLKLKWRFPSPRSEDRGADRKEPPMEKKSREKGDRQELTKAMQVLLPIAGVLATLKGSLHDLVVGAGLQVLQLLLEQDRAEICGERYRHAPGRPASRAGSAPGELSMGGRRVSVKRPRARSAAGKELELPTWKAFAAQDPLTERAVEQMVLGVTTRKYERSLEALPPEVRGRGMSKSAVSRRFVAATKAQLQDWFERSLSGLTLAALMIDGLVCGEHTVLVALGIDETGSKHILGLTEGATENAAACTSLLSSLAERGLDTSRSILVVIDGGKALAKSVRETFGRRALIQRCQVHKKRNVLDHLPESRRSSIGGLMSTAYACSDPKRALLMLQKIARQLEHKHPGAAASLREGLEETLTVLAFDLDDALKRTLTTTNPIENMNSSVRRVTRNVKTWDGGTMVLRWVGVALHEATKGFRRLKGHAGMPKLVAALRAHDAALDATASPSKEPLALRKKAA